MVKLKDIVILYAEDEVVTNKIFTKKLERITKNVYSTFNGNEAFEKYLEVKPDLIITDINMPLMNGGEFIAKVRELDSTTPIIVVTAYAYFGDLDINLIKKPINFSLFNSIIQSAISSENLPNVTDELKIQNIYALIH
ncbi:MAG: hypothetical protein C0602_02015 [Denitrovibrio sp.]|nr:MAG: hypothetical protein C0602_02015 [Denitrovibrio sp.]